MGEKIKYKSVDKIVSKLTDEAKLEIKKITDMTENDNKIQQLKEEYYKAIEKTDIIKEKIIQNLEEKADNFETKKGFTILGIKPWKIMSYFVIYSFLGFLIETIFGILTKGVIESRQSFLYGPFCGIYGLGAVIMILSLQYFMKNNYFLFFGGYIVGSIIEYFASLFGEMILHIKWWDYSNLPFNINGRVCAFYSIAWGILAIWLMRNVNPRIDDLINKIKERLPKYLIPILADLLTAFLIFDTIISGYALSIFYSRLVHDYDIDIANKEYYIEYYERILNNERKNYNAQKYFSNEKMLRTYPNIKFEDVNGNIIFVRNILSDIKPYYLKLFNSVEVVTYKEN